MTNGDLKVAHCSNDLCNAFSFLTADSAGDVGRYTSITLGTDSLPVISYYEGGIVNNLKVVHCSNDLCGATSTAAVESGGGIVNIGQYTSITVGTDGLPVISYYDVSTADLKVAHCSNRFCVPWHRSR